jgi:tetratricopeptide (TPR) repeat protein
MKLWRAGFLLILFLSACKNEPKNASADVLKKDGMPASVQQLLVQLEKHGDSTGLRLRLVNALDSMGAYQPAMVQMDSLLRKDSLNYGLWYRKAQLQQNMHDTSGALKSYRYAIRVYPTADAMLSAANLLAERKDSTALVICKQVETFRIGREYTAHCNFIIGVYYARKGNKKKALEAFNTCIANDYNYPEAYMEKGFIYYDDKKIKEALDVFQTLVDVKNTYPDGYYWLAKCYEAMNNKAEAINYYQRSLTLDPGIKEATAALERLGVK